MSTLKTSLRDHIEAHRATAQAWGSHDCALWANSCRVAIGREDHGKFFRGKYKSARGALLRMRRFGCETPVDVADKCLGERSPIAFALAGDVVAADLVKLKLTDSADGFGLALGICNGRASFFVGAQGLIAVPTLNCEFCYRG